MIVKYKDQTDFWEFVEVKSFSYKRIKEEDAERLYKEIAPSVLCHTSAYSFKTIIEKKNRPYAIMIYEDFDSMICQLINTDAYLINKDGITIERIN